MSTVIFRTQLPVKKGADGFRTRNGDRGLPIVQTRYWMGAVRYGNKNMRKS